MSSRRCSPGVYRQASIQRLGPFFRALRLGLRDVAPGQAEHPRIVLLTSGPNSETAFDQAYLASMLGLPLVEGPDLLVRDGRVWMRGVEGLEPVDVILRRVDAEWCDPLDLRQGSRLGVPGLVRAVRAGSVSVVNPLGSSVLENPAPAHVPAAARAAWCSTRTSRWRPPPRGGAASRALAAARPVPPRTSSSSCRPSAAPTSARSSAGP